VTLSRDDVFWLVLAVLSPAVAPLDAQPAAPLIAITTATAANDTLIFISPPCDSCGDATSVRHFLAEGGGAAAMNNETNTYIDVLDQRDGFLSRPKRRAVDRTLTQNRNNSFVAEKVETAKVVGRHKVGCFTASVPTNDHSPEE
jgi:hypothetical protein